MQQVSRNRGENHRREKMAAMPAGIGGAHRWRALSVAVALVLLPAIPRTLDFGLLRIESLGLQAAPPKGGWSKNEKALSVAIKEGRLAEARKVVRRLVGPGEVKGYQILLRHAFAGHDIRFEKFVGGAILREENAKIREFVYEQIGKSRNKNAVIVLLAVAAKWKDDAAFDAIHSALKSRQKEVVFAALRWIRKLAQAPRSFVPVVAALETYEKKAPGRIYYDLLKTLSSLTGTSYDNSADWRNYWKSSDGGKIEKKKTGRKPRTAVYRKPPTFFAMQVESDRVLFIIDVSTSMAKADTIIREPDKPDGDVAEKKGRTVVEPEKKGGDEDGEKRELVMRITRVQRELIRTLRGLPPNVRFGVLAFSHEMLYFDSPKSLHFATSQNKKRAIAWVEKLVPNGATRTDEALKGAFTYPEIDTIYLLTDGAPKDEKNQKIAPEFVLGVASLNNRFRKIRINTIGFSQAGRTMQQLCRDLAAQNEGKCVLLN